MIGWKSPWSYPLHEVTFCECETGARALAYWQQKTSEQQQAKLAKLFESAGVPIRFRDLTVDTLPTDPGKAPAVAAARTMIEQGHIDGKRGLLLVGPYGTGKTGLLTPVLRYWLDQGKSGLWIEFYDFTDQIQAAYSTGNSTDVLDAAQSAEWILLDDVGDLQRNDRHGGFAESTDKQRLLYQLINYRHNHELPMLLTSNLSPAQLAEQFGARTFERIMESCAIFEMGGRNLRKGK